MKNYNEMFKHSKNITEVKKLVDELNNDILDNNKDIKFDIVNLTTALVDINDNNKNDFTNSFCYAMDIDRKKAFSDLLKNPSFDRYTLITKKDGTYEIKDGKALFSFVNLEKGYQIHKSTEKDKDGKPIPNSSVTVFDALRFYGLTSVFIRNIQKSVFEIDENHKYNLENITVDNEKVFVDVDGSIFASNSNKALVKQLNVIVKFFGYDVELLRCDLPILKIKAQKITQNKTNANFKVNAIIDDRAILKFADAVFGIVSSRINDKDIEIITKKENKTK